MNKYLQQIHRCNIYDNFETIPFQTESTNITPALDDVFSGEKQNEVIIIEVGSWKGASAIGMANHLKNKGINPTIFCVDTWTGSTFHREHDIYLEMLNCENGFPTIYKQFLSNIIHSGLQENIVPVPHYSYDAARYLKKLGIIADYCYIDACHEYKEVYSDIECYYDLVKENGKLFGDDYDIGWHGVMNSVNDYVDKNNLKEKFRTVGPQWIIEK